MQAACHMQSGASAGASASASASASYAAPLLPALHERMSFQSLGKGPLRPRTLHNIGNLNLPRRCTVQYVTRSSTVAADVAEAVQRDPVQAQFDWHRQWYPVSWEQDLREHSPNKLELLGEDLVVWKDPAGEWNTFSDVCPHRLVPLSEGRVNEDGRLECPYHGWAFSGSGRCESIPQGGDPSSFKSAATAYPCIVKQGLLWVWPTAVSLNSLGAGPCEDDIPILPEAEEGSNWDPKVSVNTFRDFPYDYATLVENLADPGHVPFTHHATVSKRSTSSVIDLEVIKRGPWGFDGRWKAGPRQGQLGQMDTQLRYPTLLRHTIDAFDTKGFANITATYCVPLAPGRSRVFVRQPFRFKSKLPGFFMGLVPKWSTHLGNNKVLEDDVVFLHAQEAASVAKGLGSSPIGKVYHMPAASDAYVAAFRSWLLKAAGGGPFGPQDKTWLQAAGPRLSTEQLLDRYESHTKHCRVCSNALTNTQRAITACSIAYKLAVFTAAVAAAAALCGGQAVLTQHSTHLAASSALGSTVERAGRWLLGVSAASLPFQGTPAGCMTAAVAALGLAAVVLLVRQRLRKLERSFLVGNWPPPRNTSSVM